MKTKRRIMPDAELLTEAELIDAIIEAQQDGDEHDLIHYATRLGNLRDGISQNLPITGEPTT